MLKLFFLSPSGPYYFMGFMLKFFFSVAFIFSLVYSPLNRVEAFAANFHEFPFDSTCFSSTLIDYLNQKTERLSWEEYYHITLNMTEPRKTLIVAYQNFQQENKIRGKAADLGAGTGRDTLFLLQKEWQVLALDIEQTSLDIILNRVDNHFRRRLEVVAASFSDMRLPNGLDLINASFSLPYCAPQDFSQCWEKIVNSLAVGGRFCGQFFGENDEWASDGDLTIHSYSDLLQLFHEKFSIEYLEIQDGLTPTVDGKNKHWHVYHVVAKKLIN